MNYFNLLALGFIGLFIGLRYYQAHRRRVALERKRARQNQTLKAIVS